MNTYSRYKVSTANKKEKSLFEIIHILYRRKYILIASVSVVLVLAFIYNYITDPIYEAKVLVKKEVAPENRNPNEFYEIVRMQTQDEVETEMELVKTGEVLGMVVKDLYLFMHFNNLVEPGGGVINIEKNMLDCSAPRSEFQNLSLPRFTSIKLKEEKQSGSYFINKINENQFSLHDAQTEKLIQSLSASVSEHDSTAPDQGQVGSENYPDESKEFEFTTDLADIRFSWADAPVGSKFYFTLNSYFQSVIQFGKQVAIERKGKTNVFAVSVKATTPYSAMVLANLLIEKFRESRIEQQKQTIRYSFNFVDEQLEKMQGKLREAEDNLSDFKASGQITTIDASSQEVIKFISSLEAEKMNTDLALTEYKNKLADMQKELQSSGYFDQSFLSPDGVVDGNNPFSKLLSQLSDLELKKLELQQKRTESHPDVINLNEQIRLAKEKLASYNQNTLTAYQIIINALEKKRQDINGLTSKYEVKLEMLPGQENKLARLIREKDVYEKMFTLLLDKREEMRLAELSKLQDIIIVDPAKEPLMPVSPRKLLNIFIALVLGGFIGIIGIFLIELKNSKLVNLDAIEEEFQIPIFALIPSYPKKVRERIQKSVDVKGRFVTLMEDQDGFRESFRLLKTKLRIQMEGREKVFMVTSCEENSGKTTIVGNLAVSFAQENKRVLIVDCDLRKAQLSSMFGIPKTEPGLIDFLTKDVNPAIYTKVLKKLDVLPAGGVREDSSHLLNSEKMNDLFKFIDTSVYDYIIFDTPPVTRIVDTLILGKYLKDAVLVIRPNLSYNESVWGGILEMIQAKIKIRGIIVNGAEIKESYYYRYRYGYGYGYTSGKKKSGSEKKSKEVGSIVKTTLN